MQKKIVIRATLISTMKSFKQKCFLPNVLNFLPTTQIIFNYIKLNKIILLIIYAEDIIDAPMFGRVYRPLPLEN